jgi:cyclic pyranopterin phosphate synthase
VPRLTDSFGRIIDDLRISLTDRCNFRCVYCMPAEGLPWLPKREILSYEELLRLSRLFMALGVRTIRLTGGEPLMRKELPALLRGLVDLLPDLDLSITTNGFFLREHAARLAAAGLRRINVSLDTLRPGRFERMVRRDGSLLAEILAGIREARRVGLAPVKVNCVVMRGVNEDEIADFVGMGRTEGIQVRFIEFMPLNAQRDWSMQDVVSGAEILARVRAVFPLRPPDDHRSEPAAVHRLADGTGSVGVIASVTQPFCDHCNRVRITADGQLRTCLFSLHEYNLKERLRGGATDEELTDFIRAAVWKKEPGHKINQPDFVAPQRTMSAIGG